MLPCRALPLPFCLQGFLPPPLTSDLTLVWAWLILLKFLCQSSTSWSMSILVGTAKTSGWRSTKPKSLLSRLSNVSTHVCTGLRCTGTAASHLLNTGRLESDGGGGLFALAWSTRLEGMRKFEGRAFSPEKDEDNILEMPLPHTATDIRNISVNLIKTTKYVRLLENSL